jgi:hypothetical protein
MAGEVLPQGAIFLAGKVVVLLWLMIISFS